MMLAVTPEWLDELERRLAHAEELRAWDARFAAAHPEARRDAAAAEQLGEAEGPRESRVCVRDPANKPIPPTTEKFHR